MEVKGEVFIWEKAGKREREKGRND